MDYKNGKIYKILNDINDEVYVGSTTQSLSKRMAKHRGEINTQKQLRGKNKLYEKMRELGKDHFYIELVEECPCDNIEQLHAREGQLIRELGTLNSRIEKRTPTEYNHDNKEKIKTYKRGYAVKYRTENPEKEKERKQKWAENNADVIKEKKHLYYETNKERTLEMQKKRYERDKERINQERRIKYALKKQQALQKESQ